MLYHFFHIHPCSKIHAEQAEFIGEGLEQKITNNIVQPPVLAETVGTQQFLLCCLWAGVFGILCSLLTLYVGLL